MRALAIATTFVVCCIFVHSDAVAQSTKCNNYNFANRKAHIVNLAPGLEITKYTFCNTDGARFQSQFVEDLAWKNTGSLPIVTYEVVTIKYDAFNRRLIGSKLTFGGISSASWTPLEPGMSSADGLLDHGTSYVLTGIAYINAVRYADGRVWTSDPAKLIEAVRRVLSDFKDVGELTPDTPQRK